MSGFSKINKNQLKFKEEPLVFISKHVIIMKHFKISDFSKLLHKRWEQE